MEDVACKSRGRTLECAGAKRVSSGQWTGRGPLRWNDDVAELGVPTVNPALGARSMEAFISYRSRSLNPNGLPAERFFLRRPVDRGFRAAPSWAWFVELGAGLVMEPAGHIHIHGLPWRQGHHCQQY